MNASEDFLNGLFSIALLSGTGVPQNCYRALGWMAKDSGLNSLKPSGFFTYHQV
jgi:hypothetical protein